MTRFSLLTLTVVTCFLSLFFMAGSAIPAYDPPHFSTPPVMSDCYECHISSPHHGYASYPAALNILCEGCHYDGGPATGVVTHSSRTTDSGYGDWDLDCWSCHNPHHQEQDINYGTTYGKYIRKNLNAEVKEIDPNDPGPYYWPLSILRTVTSTNIRFTGPTEFVDGDIDSDDDICQVCHESTSYYNPSTAFNTHANLGTDSQPGGVCTSCHPHDSGFKALGGCTGCHATGGPGIQVQAEFERNSHHIQKAWADMTGTDCIVCHAEGTLSADGSAAINSTYHNNPVGTVDLYDADDRGTIYSIALSSGAVPKNDAVNTTLDAFCMSCHDSNGAGAIGGGNWPTAYANDNPFGEVTTVDDDVRTNRYDQVQKNFGATGSLNVFDAFDPTGGDGSDADSKTNNHHAVRGQRYSINTGLAFGTSLADAGVLSSTLALYDGTTGTFDDSTFHCNDCHSTGYSNHGSNNEYLLQTSAAENPTTEHTGDNYVCLKCHIGGYNTTGHFGNAGDYEHSSDQTGAARMTANDGHYTGIGCLNCHDGAVGFGGIHGLADATYTSGEGIDHWKRRFLPGSGLAFYAPGSAGSLTWAGRTNYVTGEKVIPTTPNGFLYQVITAGQSNRNEPSWCTTVGCITTDGSGVQYQNIGSPPAVSEAEWEYSDANASNRCYTQTSAGAYSACTHHSGGTSKNARPIQRPVDY